MNRFNISVINWDFKIPCGYMSAQEVQSIVNANKVADEIKEKASKEAQAIIDKAKKEASEYLEKVQKDWEEEKQELKKVLREEILQEHIKWLVDEHDIDKSLVQCASTRIKHAIKIVLQNWMNKQDISLVLINRLNAEIQKMSNVNSLTLQVCNVNVEKMQENFKDILKVLENNDLKEDEALLQSSCLCIKLSLKDHMESILNWLFKGTRAKE